MKKSLALLAVFGLTACVEETPDEGLETVAPLPGVIGAPGVISSEIIWGSTSYEAADTPEAEANEIVFEPLIPESEEQVVDTDSSVLSDENDFEAVSERQSIESDAERLARNRELYTLIEPTDLPQRPGQAGPNIVAYALATNNPVGEPLYQRMLFNAERRYIDNCASYASPDLAQIDFLANGGPERDKFGIDPDGDGFACAWDPTPFRQVQKVLALPADQ